MIKLNLHVLLAQYRISQKDLSDMTGIRPPTISAYCSNTFKHIVTSHLDKICYVLNCVPQDIIIYENTVPEGIDEVKRKDIFDKAYKNTPKYMVRADNGEAQLIGETVSEYISNMSNISSQNTYNHSDESKSMDYESSIDERINKIESNIKTYLSVYLDNIIREKLKDTTPVEKEIYPCCSDDKDKDKK